jgi:hypothetical protein
VVGLASVALDDTGKSFVIVVSEDGLVRAFDENQPRWARRLPGASHQTPARHAPFAVGVDTVGVLGPQGVLVLLRATDGAWLGERRALFGALSWARSAELDGDKRSAELLIQDEIDGTLRAIEGSSADRPRADERLEREELVRRASMGGSFARAAILQLGELAANARDRPAAHLALARALLAAREVEAARREASDVLKTWNLPAALGPRARATLSLAARAPLAEGRRLAEEARADVHAMLERGRRAEVAALVVDAIPYLLKNQPDAALELAELAVQAEGLQGDPLEVQARRVRAFARLSRRSALRDADVEIERARTDLEAFLSVSPDDEEARVIVALCALARDDDATASDVLDATAPGDLVREARELRDALRANPKKVLAAKKAIEVLQRKPWWRVLGAVIGKKLG